MPITSPVDVTKSHGIGRRTWMADLVPHQQSGRQLRRGSLPRADERYREKQREPTIAALLDAEGPASPCASYDWAAEECAARHKPPAYAKSGRARTDARADCACMTLGTEIRLLDEVAAGLRAMAANAVVYDDDVVLWLADQVEQAADYAQELADAEAAKALFADR
jgi:hypothetical protein